MLLIGFEGQEDTDVDAQMRQVGIIAATTVLLFGVVAVVMMSMMW